MHGQVGGMLTRLEHAFARHALIWGTETCALERASIAQLKHDIRLVCRRGPAVKKHCACWCSWEAIRECWLPGERGSSSIRLLFSHFEVRVAYVFDKDAF